MPGAGGPRTRRIATAPAERGSVSEAVDQLTDMLVAHERQNHQRSQLAASQEARALTKAMATLACMQRDHLHALAQMRLMQEQNLERLWALVQRRASLSRSNSETTGTD